MAQFGQTIQNLWWKIKLTQRKNNLEIKDSQSYVNWPKLNTGNIKYRTVHYTLEAS
jgi:hypothetical protein